MLSQTLLFKIRICGLWWHPMKYQESTEKWKVTAFCSTYRCQHLSGKILPRDGRLWRYETYHLHRAELRGRCSKSWHNPASGLSHVETHTSPAARGLFPARTQHAVLWNHHVLCMLVFIRSNTQGSLPSQMLPSLCRWEVLRYLLHWLSSDGGKKSLLERPSSIASVKMIKSLRILYSLHNMGQCTYNVPVCKTVSSRQTLCLVVILS